MKKNHSFYFNELCGAMGKKLMYTLAPFVFPRERKFRVKFYQNVREAATVCGVKDKSSIQHDVIIVLCKIFGVTHGQRAVFIGIEIKDTLRDLLNDEKMLQYLGASEYQFYGVPEFLVSKALRKIESFGEKARYIGLINLDEGVIVKMPKKHPVRQERRQAMITDLFLVRDMDPKRVSLPVAFVTKGRIFHYNS